MDESTIQRLKEKGIVATAQRLAVIALINNAKQHMTAEDIYQKVRLEFPTITLATVYNILEKFVEVGEIQQLSIMRDRACFDWRVTSHHHFYCNFCNRVFDINIMCNVARAGFVDGNKVDSMQAYFYGMCQECLKKTEES